ncbi:MAG: hypothetical protein ACTSQP_13005 [Promethearchaeota archaeon]
MFERFMSLGDDEEGEFDYPSSAWIALARRGMERISLEQCFLIGCDNTDPKLLEPFAKEEYEDEEKHIKIISIKCKKCGGTFKLKFETLKKVAKPTKTEGNPDEEALSMGLVYALDENDKNLGHIGYF